MTGPKVLHRERLLALGYDDNELRRLLRSGALVRVGRGSYARAAGVADPAALVLARARSALRRLDEPAVLSHTTAATVLGLPTWGPAPARVQVTRDASSGGRRTSSTHVRTAPLAAHEVTSVAGLLVTSPARTVVDVARLLGEEPGVVTADAALRTGVVSREELETALERARGWPGIARARRAVRFADPLSESVGESRSRVAIARVGLPAPRLQRVVRTGGGVVVGRVDFLWEDHRTIGEFDGLVKYRGVVDDDDPGDVVTAEKLREDALRTEGYEVVRWIWSELDRFPVVRGRIARAFARADRGR